MALFNISLTGKQKKEEVKDEPAKDAVVTIEESLKNTKEDPPKPKKEPKARTAAPAPTGWIEVNSVAGSPMIKIIEGSPTPPRIGDLLEGPIIDIHKSSVFVDLKPFGTGIIYGREYINARDLLKKANIGDNITAKVVDTYNEDGYIELSVKEARQALVWSEAEEAINKKVVLEIPVKAANKGGLILEWQGIQGFLPASQLKAEHYPRVLDGDKDRILEELQKLVGQKISVCILVANPKEGKLIFSEKEPEQKEKQQLVDKYTVGDIIDGEITGIVDFGLFVKIQEGLEGLVHISEMDWGLVENPRTMFKIGEKIKAQVIEIKEGKISLSIKALKENPWASAEKKYKPDDIVEGVVIKYNKHGALVSIEEGVAGLAHISEFGTNEKLQETMGLGKSYRFKIKLFEPKEQRMTLSYLEAQESIKA